MGPASDTRLVHATVRGLAELGVGEVSELTPWLAMPEGLAAIGRVLGLSLRSPEIEFPVGADWRVDLRAEDQQGRVVLVEAQRGAADQLHLGKLLIYAYNTPCALVVWVAEAFRPEQLTVIDNLNARAGSGPRFSAIAIRAHALPSGQVALAFEPVRVPRAKLGSQLTPEPSAPSRAPAPDVQPVASRLFWHALKEIDRAEVPCPHGLWVEWRGWGTAVAGVQCVVVTASDGLRLGLVGPRKTPCLGTWMLTDDEVLAALNAALPPEYQLARIGSAKPALPHLGLSRPWPTEASDPAALQPFARFAADVVAALKEALVRVSERLA